MGVVVVDEVNGRFDAVFFAENLSDAPSPARVNGSPKGIIGATKYRDRGNQTTEDRSGSEEDIVEVYLLVTRFEPARPISDLFSQIHVHLADRHGADVPGC